MLGAISTLVCPGAEPACVVDAVRSRAEARHCPVDVGTNTDASSVNRESLTNLACRLEMREPPKLLVSDGDRPGHKASVLHGAHTPLGQRKCELPVGSPRGLVRRYVGVGLGERVRAVRGGWCSGAAGRDEWLDGRCAAAGAGVVRPFARPEGPAAAAAACPDPYSAGV